MAVRSLTTATGGTRQLAAHGGLAGRALHRLPAVRQEIVDALAMCVGRRCRTSLGTRADRGRRACRLHQAHHDGRAMAGQF